MIGIHTEREDRQRGTDKVTWKHTHKQRQMYPSDSNNQQFTKLVLLCMCFVLSECV